MSPTHLVLRHATARGATIASIASILCLSLAQPVAAEESPPLRLGDVIREAMEQNPEIRAARDKQRAAAAIPNRVSAYDDPMFSYEAWNAPESFRIDRADNN